MYGTQPRIALSRPRHEGRFYATAPELDQPLEPRPDPLGDLKPLLRALERDGRQRLAVEALGEAAIRGLSDTDLKHEAERLRPLTHQHPAIAAVALERLHAERAAPYADLHASQTRLARQREQLAPTPVAANARSPSKPSPAANAPSRGTANASPP